MVSKEGLRSSGSAERSHTLANYVARNPTLRDDFILIARRDGADDVVVITVGDIAGDDSKGPTSDVSLRP